MDKKGFFNLLSQKKVDRPPIWVDYIESHGKEYIDTGFIIKQKITWSVTFEAMELNKAFGAQSNGNRVITLVENDGNSNIIHFVSSTDTYIDDDNPIKTFYVNFLDNYIYNRGVTAQILPLSTEDTLPSFYFFGVHKSGNIEPVEYTKSRLYSSQFYNKDVLVRNFRPCLSTERNHYLEPCLYDTVKGEYYYNQGSGSFTYGNIITELDYIESNGNQYIKIELPTEMYIDGTYNAQITQFTNDAVLLDCINGASIMIPSDHKAFKTINIKTGYSYDFELIPHTSIPYKIERMKEYAYISGISTKADTNADIAFYLFAHPDEIESGNEGSYMQLYKFVGTEHDYYYVHLYEFMPCIMPDGNIGVWDWINGVFRKSETNSAFIAGPRTLNLDKVLKKADCFPKPTCYYINQTGSTSSPTEMVSENYSVDWDGTETMISSSGSVGNSETNMITWLREHSHSYVVEYDSTNTETPVRIRQLLDTDNTKFEDGSDATDYITGAKDVDTTKLYDVMMKFDTDVYYKTEAAEYNGAINEDYVRVTISNRIPLGDITHWNKWSKNMLIGTMESYNKSSRARSISGVVSTPSVTQAKWKTYSRNHGKGFKLIDYGATVVMALLFYPYYKTLNCQAQCGRGENTNNKTCGLTLSMGKSDTTSSNSNTTNGIRYWMLENWWGNKSEFMDDIYMLWSYRPDSVTTKKAKAYLLDYFDSLGKDTLIITESGKDVEYTREMILACEADRRFIAFEDIDGNVTRILKASATGDKGNYCNKLIFGKYSDIFYKEITGTSSTYFCDSNIIGNSGKVSLVSCRSHSLAYANGGVAYLSVHGTASNAGANYGSRLLYDGDYVGKNIPIVTSFD